MVCRLSTSPQTPFHSQPVVEWILTAHHLPVVSVDSVPKFQMLQHVWYKCSVLVDHPVLIKFECCLAKGMARLSIRQA